MRTVTRVFAFFANWLSEVIRQPLLMVTLVVGPFVILLAFGTGVQMGGTPPRVAVVTNATPGDALALLPSLAEMQDRVQIVEETTDLAHAEDELQRGTVDAVVVLPDDPAGYLQRGERVPLRVLLGEIDPVRRSYANAFLQDSVADLNRRAIERAAELAQQPLSVVLDASGATADVQVVRDLPPDVVSAPMELSIESPTGFIPDFTQFYAPAILALLIQHLGVTLGAFSFTRMRRIGLLDTLRTTPIRSSEVLVGHYLSYGCLIALVLGSLLAAVIVILGVPVAGSWLVLASVLAGLALTSLGLGFAISLISSSEQQAVQLAMLLLIASIFFGGMAFTLDRIEWPARAISFALPVTYAMRALQDVMLRGVLRHPEDLAVLLGGAFAFFVLSAFLMRRAFRPV